MLPRELQRRCSRPASLACPPSRRVRRSPGRHRTTAADVGPSPVIDQILPIPQRTSAKPSNARTLPLEIPAPEHSCLVQFNGRWEDLIEMHHDSLEQVKSERVVVVVLHNSARAACLPFAESSSLAKPGSEALAFRRTMASSISVSFVSIGGMSSHSQMREIPRTRDRLLQCPRSFQPSLNIVLSKFVLHSAAR